MTSSRTYGLRENGDARRTDNGDFGQSVAIAAAERGNAQTLLGRARMESIGREGATQERRSGLGRFGTREGAFGGRRHRQGSARTEHLSRMRTARWMDHGEGQGTGRTRRRDGNGRLRRRRRSARQRRERDVTGRLAPTGRVHVFGHRMQFVLESVQGRRSREVRVEAARRRTVGGRRTGRTGRSRTRRVRRAHVVAHRDRRRVSAAPAPAPAPAAASARRRVQSRIVRRRWKRTAQRLETATGRHDRR